MNRRTSICFLAGLVLAFTGLSAHASLDQQGPAFGGNYEVASRAFASGDFVNAASGLNSTIFGLAAYPGATRSANLFSKLKEHVSLGAGVHGGSLGSRTREQFIEPLCIGELSWAFSGHRETSPARLAIGSWRRSADFERFDGASVQGADGFYAVAESRLLSFSGPDVDDGRGASLFLQWSDADKRLSLIKRQLALGFSVTGLWESRPLDGFGLSWNHARTSRVSGAGTHANESAIEAYLTTRLTRGWTAKLDVQRIQYPGSFRDAPKASFVALRTVLAF